MNAPIAEEEGLNDNDDDDTDMNENGEKSRCVKERLKKKRQMLTLKLFCRRYQDEFLMDDME